MSYQLRTEAEIENLGIIKYVVAPWDAGLQLTTSENGEIISARDLGYARRKVGINHSLSQNGSRIKEGVVYTQKPRILLIRNSPLLQRELAEEANQSHRNGKEYFIAQTLATEYEQKASESSDSEVFPLTNRNPIKTKEFETDKRALWIFQDEAEEQGRFLFNNGITEMPLWFDSDDYITKQEKPYANQLWLYRLVNDDRSGLVGYYGRYLGCSFGTRGVFKNLGEAQTQKISKRENSELYSPKQITKALKSLELKGLERMLLKKLREKA